MSSLNDLQLTRLGAQRIAIAGGGLSGRMLAWLLAEAGAIVTLFDRDTVEGQASCGYTGAGMLAPVAELDSAEPVVAKLGIESLPLWKELGQRLPLPVYQACQGTLVVAHQPDWPDLLRFQGHLQRGLKHPILRPYQNLSLIQKVQWNLSRSGIEAVVPGLSAALQRGLFIPEEGQIDNRQLYKALENALLSSGVTWKTNTPVAEVSSGCITLETGEQFFADWAIDTCGLGSSSPDLPLRGVRGEIIRVYAPEVDIACSIRVMHPRHPIYIAPRENHHYLIGATSIESYDQRPVTIQSALELLSAAFSIHSGFAEASILELSSNCRPALPDNIPKIQVQPGLIRLNGLYRHGFLMLPKLVQLVLQYMSTHQYDLAYNELFHLLPLKKEMFSYEAVY